MTKLLVLLALLPLAAFAQQTATIMLTPPTQRTDGSALLASQIAGYEVQCVGWTPTGGTRGTCTQFAQVTITGTSGTLSGSVPATGGTACFVARTRDTSGLVSANSGEACKTFAAVPPNPPTNVTIAVILGVEFAPAYKYTAKADGTGSRSSALAGLIPTGKPCSGSVLFTYRGKPYKDVAQADVLWEPNGVTPSEQVAAVCN